jgi:thiol-disulfide isomerase/thioredoxin
MKSQILLSFLLCFFSISAIAQERPQIITIKGTITGAQPPVYLFCETQIHTLELSGDRFQLEVSVSQTPSFFSLGGINSKTGRITRFTPKIWFGTASQEVSLDLSQEPASLSITSPYSHQQLSEQIDKASKKERLKLITSNINTLPALFFLHQSRGEYSEKEIRNALAGLDETMPDNPHLLKIQSYLKAKQLDKPKKGSSFVELELMNTNAVQEKLSAQNDTPTVLAFMATGCPYSVNAMEPIAGLQQQYKDKVRIITIWGDPNFDIFAKQETEKKAAINWQNLWDQHGFAETYFGIDETPTYMFVSPEGIIQDRFVGTGRLQERLGPFLDTE